MNLSAINLDIETLSRGYREARFTPENILQEVVRRIEEAPERHVWITFLDWERICSYLERLP